MKHYYLLSLLTIACFTKVMEQEPQSIAYSFTPNLLHVENKITERTTRTQEPGSRHRQGSTIYCTSNFKIKTIYLAVYTAGIINLLLSGGFLYSAIKDTQPEQEKIHYAFATFHGIVGLAGTGIGSYVLAHY
jgi:hypothetical protein